VFTIGYRGNKSRSGVRLSDTVQLDDSENPIFVHGSGSGNLASGKHLLHKPSYGKISVKISKFLPRDALSAKRGLAIACRPSVRLSVRL